MRLAKIKSVSPGDLLKFGDSSNELFLIISIKMACGERCCDILWQTKDGVPFFTRDYYIATVLSNFNEIHEETCKCGKCWIFHPIKNS
jgi:hypothetical protein